MGIAVAIAVGVVAAALLWLMFSGVAARRTRQATPTRPEPGDPGVDTLRYHVPDAQDPAVVMTALGQAGYNAHLDEARGEKYVVVACPAGRERERARVRSVIVDADQTSLEGPELHPGRVSFDDEK